MRTTPKHREDSSPALCPGSGLPDSVSCRSGAWTCPRASSLLTGGLGEHCPGLHYHLLWNSSPHIYLFISDLHPVFQFLIKQFLISVFLIKSVGTPFLPASNTILEHISSRLSILPSWLPRHWERCHHPAGVPASINSPGHTRQWLSDCLQDLPFFVWTLNIWWSQTWTASLHMSPDSTVLVFNWTKYYHKNGLSHHHSGRLHWESLRNFILGPFHFPDPRLSWAPGGTS